MKWIVFALIFLSSASYVQAQIPFICKGQYYLSLTPINVDNSLLYEVKLSPNGQNVVLENISANTALVLNGMGYRITDNFIYGIDPESSRLRKLGADGLAVDLGLPLNLPLNGLYYAGDVTPDGKYLIVIGLRNGLLAKIDLQDNNYTCTTIPLSSSNIGIVDIAFDPFSGILYGHDYVTKKLVTIDYNNGSINGSFLVQPQVTQLGALFFDSFGNLFGYGSYGSPIENKLVSINKKTGNIRLLLEGPDSYGQDGCACPYTMELQKVVSPDTSFACTYVTYSFIVSNGSGATRTNISLQDTMPINFVVKEVLSNPFGGIVRIDKNILVMEQMVVKAGIDTIKVLVETGQSSPGVYKNQAFLSGLPPALGSSTRSDDPLTIFETDSTALVIKPFEVTLEQDEYVVCTGDSIKVNVGRPGLDIIWNDLDTSAIKWLYAPEVYQVLWKTLCDSKIATIITKSSGLNISIPSDTITINLGEWLDLKSETSSTFSPINIEWMSENKDLIECASCEDSRALPLNDGRYFVTATDALGCIKKDTLIVRVIKNRAVFYPNIISANGDQVNDLFFLSTPADATNILVFSIYDRWGNLVHERKNYKSNDTNAAWNGYFNGKPAEQGVYTWIAKLSYLDGYQQTISGSLTLIR